MQGKYVYCKILLRLVIVIWYSENVDVEDEITLKCLINSENWYHQLIVETDAKKSRLVFFAAVTTKMVKSYFDIL